LLVCDGITSKWALSAAKGVDPNNALVSQSVTIPAGVDGDAVITDSSGNPISTADWGMPSLTQIFTGGDVLKDTYENFYCERVDTNRVTATTDVNGNALKFSDRYDYFPCKDFIKEKYTTKSSYVAKAVNIQIIQVSGQWVVRYANFNNDNTQLVGVTFYKINK
jgi:hypothetical protein